MTVSTELSHEEYTGNGVTTDFDFRFRIFEAKHLVVSVADPAGTERILTNGTDYTLRGVGSYRGGKVILKMPLATGWKIGIARDLPAVQETDLRNQGKFFAEVHEDAFDYLTMLIQKSLGYLSLCLRKSSFISDHYDAKGNKISNLGKPVKDGDAVDLGTMKEHIEAKDKRSLRVADKDIPALPNVVNRANKLLSFDNNGNPVVIVPESGSAADVLTELGKSDGFALIGMIQSVSQLKQTSGSIGTHVYVKSYIAGKNIGGGFFESVPVTTNADEVIVFSGMTNNWKRINFGLEVSVYDAGYYDGQDIAVYINKVNSAGYDCTVPGNGTFSSAIEIDVSKGALIGTNKCKLTEASGISGDYAVRIFNGNTDYSARDFINANASISGVAFNFSGEKKISIGGAGTGESSEIRISNCGFIGSKGIEFLDNSYRILFDKCTISRSFYDTVIFNSPANSGEMIKFSFCWIVDNGGPLTLVNGQFAFEGCSIPAGKKEGYFDSTVFVKDNAHCTFSGGNIEFQPGASFVAFSVSGSSRLCIRDTTILTPAGYSALPVVSNDDGIVLLSDCSLPLFDQPDLSAGAATRQVIGGGSKKVTSRGCYPRAGFIATEWHKGNIVSPYINSLSNGSGQFSNYANWGLTQIGTGVVTAGSDTDTPNDLIYSTSLYVAIPAAGASADFFQDNESCEPGRYFQLGFWAKSPITTVASIAFFDNDGNSVYGRNEYAIPIGNEWKFYALVDVVPTGTHRVRINFRVSGTSGALHLHNIIYGLI